MLLFQCQPQVRLSRSLRILAIACLAIGLLSIADISLADIAPDPLSGGVSLSGTTKSVEMSEEVVTLKISESSCTTNAVFMMKNLTDVDVTMDVGFPYAYPDDLREFEVKVGGQVVQDVALKSLGRRRKWKVWTMTFPANAITTVEVDYWNELQQTNSWTMGIESVPNLLLKLTPWKSKTERQATPEEKRQYEELAERLQHRQVGYILRTGAGWAGNIGKCRIEAKFDGITSENLITQYPIANEEYLPRDPQVREDGLVWVLEDFEPKQDISFQISPYITQQEVKDLIEENLKQHPHHPQLTGLYGHYCDSPEEQITYLLMIDDMLAVWSKKFAIDGPDYIDRDHASQSFKVWFLVRDMTIRQNARRPLTDARRKKLLPVIQKIAERMRSQMPSADQERSDRLNTYQVKTFRRESAEVLAWCERYK
ncbi:MAG: DUF4424 family protein [Planctomycetaceae bacterium]|nr:DUF4424 domain-containing protein [Planctomycetaceae bacterium]MDG2390406.1 DUF4424 family protein [Planctomycetaceae bacterium]